MLFDRHLEKNGGFSMHTAMQNSVTAAGSKLNCTRLFGYQINNKDWVEMASLLTQKQSICVDGHSPVPSDWLQRARAVASEVAATGTTPRVLTTLRIRKPTDHYRSFYEWDQVPRMNQKWATNVSLIEFIMMTPDLQASTLLESNRAVLAQHRKGATEPLSASECAAALETAADVDLLTTTEAMTEMWPVLRRLTEFALPEEHIHEGPKRFGCCGPAVSLLVDKVEQATRTTAPCDWMLYEMAQRATSKLLDEWRTLSDAKE